MNEAKIFTAFTHLIRENSYSAAFDLIPFRSNRPILLRFLMRKQEALKSLYLLGTEGDPPTHQLIPVKSNTRTYRIQQSMD